MREVENILKENIKVRKMRKNLADRRALQELMVFAMRYTTVHKRGILP